MEIIELSTISIKESSEIDERFIQEYIAKNPKILGLGDIVLKDMEKIQPKAGRLDLLFQDSEVNRRYETEIQLGKTDESHIIRTIEYWDIERKRYPQFDHCAVIIAEDITTRFLNVIQLFNGHIPLIAIQMNAFKIDEKSIALKFIKILDENKIIVDDENNIPTDRSYWEAQGSKESMSIADEICGIINEFEPNITLKYNSTYIGISRKGRAFNFVWMYTKKQFLRIEVASEKNEELEKLLEENDIDTSGFNVRQNCYIIRIRKNDILEKKIL